MPSQLNMADLLKQRDALKAQQEMLAAKSTEIDSLIAQAQDAATNGNPRAAALGMFKGKLWISDDFQNPLTDDELKEWGL